MLIFYFYMKPKNYEGSDERLKFAIKISLDKRKMHISKHSLLKSV